MRIGSLARSLGLGVRASGDWPCGRSSPWSLRRSLGEGTGSLIGAMSAASADTGSQIRAARTKLLLLLILRRLGAGGDRGLRRGGGRRRSAGARARAGVGVGVGFGARRSAATRGGRVLVLLRLGFRLALVLALVHVLAALRVGGDVRVRGRAGLGALGRRAGARAGRGAAARAGA